MTTDAVPDIEAFGPVSTLMPYDSMDEAVALAARGRGSLVVTLVTRSPRVAAQLIPQMAAWHGRRHILDRQSALESTGHGSPLPQLKHGGPRPARCWPTTGSMRCASSSRCSSATPLQARLTCKRKINRNKKDAQGHDQGVVAWDVEVSNQRGELVASYDILTLVAKRS